MLKNWEIEVLDVKTAFLYGELDEDLYVEQPEGFIIKGQEGKVQYNYYYMYYEVRFQHSPSFRILLAQSYFLTV